ncbi:MAG: hypothetical protein M9958_06630 [Chitinophagales bacterium]|nr:hypothetical protein [Chitinophagales bacterium]
MQNIQKPSVLYIHGYESSPIASKTTIISDLGYSVIAPKIHYKEGINTFKRLKNLANYFDVKWLIGSSLGGYTAFWLSQELNIPTILFNPSLPFSKIDPGLAPKSIEIKNFQQHIFLGMQDDVVNPITTKEWLKQKHLIDKVNIIEHPSNGHQIPLDVFHQTISSFI